MGELFQRHGRRLLVYLRGKAGANDAPDLLQETFVRAMRHGGLEAMPDPEAFLQVIATNLARDRARRRNTEAKYLEFREELPEAPSPEAPPGDASEENDRSQLLIATIESLPPRCREVFVLVMQENLPVKKAAERLGISDSMARRHIRLAFRRCREAVR
ncbi:RNA polymerase sigma factor [Methylosinus sp. LW4]|uniref:RNA polymerase sigma factor n=1 Tax=Methylosinus sp. LW4 TaxID=136993 RepID=UPI001FDABD06|nr:RNA polymerase sigma factor [Methylosinus sp. LW4]